ncbi:MAG TPA: aspartate kinase [Ktedonobacteraceae bacterium]|nr:aspartate kinase [Ktedonobacteraceae bacterium]
MERSVSVLKFGGTSVGSGERIRQVAQIVARQAQQFEEDFPAVVVSAMAGVTDQLLRITRSITTGEFETGAREVEALKAKHRAAAEVVTDSPAERARLWETLEEAFARFEQDVERLRAAGSDPDVVPLRTAGVAAWGERLSVLLVASAVRTCGIEAEAVRDEVIVIEAPRSEIPYVPGTVIGADPLADDTRANAARLVVPLLERGVVPVMAGFIGRTEDGIVATLGRNGSDYSAAVIGAAIDCVQVEIYTDVDGVLTADPRVVPNARLLPHLSYAEAAQLSWFGAKVLHPRTLIPLATRNVPVRVRNTFHPHNRGTIVGPVLDAQRSAATAITVRRQLALITVESRHLFGASENVGPIFALAARAGITPVAVCSSSGHHLSFVVEEKMADSVVQLLAHDLENWKVSSRKGLAACACIGSGFTGSPMSPARAATALARERIPVITQGASDLGIILIIEDRDSERALRSLHRDLVAPVIPLVRHHTQEKLREVVH